MKTKQRSSRKFAIEQLEVRRVLASDFLLEIEGIKGESSDQKHPATIELDSFSWGASNPQSSGPADPLTAEEFRFISSVSKASPLLLQSAYQGKHIPQATLYAYKPGTNYEYLKIKLTDILISSVQSRSLNEELPKEEVSISFAKIQQEYLKTNADGTVGRPVITSWDLKKSSVKREAGASLLEDRPSSNKDESDAFLRISGIKGESTDTDHKDWIIIESFSWGVSQSQSQGNGGGGGAGKVNVQDFHFVSRVDKSSPLLANAVATGKHIAKVEFSVRRGGENSQDFLKIKLEDVLISSVQSVGSSSAEPMQEVTLNFAKFTQSYATQDASGKWLEPVVVALDGAAASSTRLQGSSLLEKTVPTAQPSDVFLEIGGIKGESNDRKHKEALEIQSWSWGLSQQSSSSGGGSGKVSVQDFSFVASNSKASPEIMASVAKGEHIKYAQLSVRKAGEQQLDYLAYKLQDILVTSYQSQSLSTSVPTDSFSLNFTKVEQRYSQQNADGSLATPIKFDWNIPASAQRVPNDFSSLLAPPTNQASGFDAFLEIDGIKGESTQDKHQKWIEINSFSWGVSQTGANSSGGGGGAGKVSVQDFHFVAPVSLASPLLADAVVSGIPQRRPNATLFVQKEGSAGYLKYELKNVVISSYLVRSINNEQPLEEFSIQFGDLDSTYRTSSDSRGQFEVTEGSLDVRSSDARLRGPSIIADTKVTSSAYDSFLKIDGIKGESSDSKHKDTIEIQSFSWGVSQTGALSSGGGGGAGKVSMQDFHFVMDTSSATSELAKAVASGKHIATAVLTVRRPGSSTDYLKYKLEDVLISGFSTRAIDESSPQEEVSINFGRVEQQYKLQTPTGGNGDVSSSSWSNWTEPVDYEPGRSILAETTPQKAAFDYFLKFDGIDGEANDKDHKGEINLDSFSWGMSRPITSRDRGGIGELQMVDFDFKANTSTASPRLLAALAQGKHFPQAILTARKGGDAPSDYLKIKLTDILISSYSLGGTNGQGTSDRFSLNFTKIGFVSPPQSTPGTTLFASAAVADTSAVDNLEPIPLIEFRSSSEIAENLFASPEDLLEMDPWLPISSTKKILWHWEGLGLFDQEAQSDELLESL